ncbi:hypothetical protein F511_46803 [Dorcoceras hygrometricum]|uniref:Uncharacterized protein n=1 Tax=Dorcoceras hygrometricum TaxID=472368 RepID=A0A2Z6ZSP2_9LAMI|nr:hypothetical protein F511_46803 [Dorcoceras hygrometricum]
MADASRAWSCLRSGSLAQAVARLVERRCALAGRIVAPLCAAPREMVARRMRATMDGEWSTGCERRRAAARRLRRAAAHDARRPRDVARGVVRCRRYLRGGGAAAGRRSGESPAMS